MSSKAQWERVNGYIQLGIEEGATLAYGGKRPEHLDRGYFMEPTIFTDVRNDMRIAQEEIFGPVLCVERFSTEEEAIAIANDSIYGLNAAVWSGDLPRAMRVASRIRPAPSSSTAWATSAGTTRSAATSRAASGESSGIGASRSSKS